MSIAPQSRDQKTPVALPLRPAQGSAPATSSPSSVVQNGKLWLRRLFGLAVVTVVIVGVWRVLDSGGTKVDGQIVYHTVKRTDLDITVTERGNLESQINEVVFCEVDDVREDGINGTPIVWIVDNGASVKKGELIVELDSAPIRERLDAQVLQVEEEKAEFIQADVEYMNQEKQNETSLAEAKLKVDLAQLSLEQFGDESAGTFQLDLQDIELSIQTAEADQLIQQTNLRGVETLYKLGYRSSGELAEARLETLKAERTLAKAISSKREKVKYEFNKMKMELEGALDSSRRAQEQVKLDNLANLAQSKARLQSSREQLRKEEERLARYSSQVEKCKIYAPQDGMVAYYVGSRYRREEIRAGAPVRPRQKILTLPNLQQMQVKTAIHESVLDQVKPNLSASVTVDAFPDTQYPASVESVAVLPDQGGWLSSDTKVYTTIVAIDDEVQQLKPGMTAVVDIHVAHLDDVVAIPVQAVVQIGNATWCYVEHNGRHERRDIELGMSNSKYVEVKTGLSPGQHLVLNPSLFQDGQQQTDQEKVGEASIGPQES